MLTSGRPTSAMRVHDDGTIFDLFPCRVVKVQKQVLVRRFLVADVEFV